MYLLVTSRKGISSMQLAKEIGVTQKTAWFVLGRLREACGGDDLPKLSGVIPMKNVPPILDKVADVVLAYRPKPKSKAAQKRKRKAARCVARIRSLWKTQRSATQMKKLSGPVSSAARNRWLLADIARQAAALKLSVPVNDKKWVGNHAVATKRDSYGFR